jgi:glycine betaine/proline transport system permease protein
MTAVHTKPPAETTSKEQQPFVAAPTWRDRISTSWLVGGVIAAWVIVWSFAKNHDTLFIPQSRVTSVHEWLLNRFDDLESSNFFVLQGLHKFGEFLRWIVEQIQPLISKEDFPRPYPQIGWLGVVAVAVWIALAVAGWRSAVLVGLSFMAFGYLGLFEDSVDTLIITALAVLLSVAIGIPLAIWMGRSKAATAGITPILDVLQTFPAFTYLTPLSIFFGIGASSAVIATVLFAFPPVVRIAAYGIQTVSPTSIEATRSLGQTRWQEIRKVQLPMARRTIIVGINQTTMAALSMVIIAAYVGGPGLGDPVLQGLQSILVGQSFVPGLAIVIMAIMLDRTTTAASERAERLQRSGGGNPRQRHAILGGAGIAALVCVYVSHQYAWAAGFPETSIGTRLANKVQSMADWISTHWDTQTVWIKDKVSYGFLNPLQDLLSESPWYLTALAILALAGILGGRWAVGATVICIAGIYVLDLWYNAMLTLTMTLVATVFVMILAMLFGVWMGRSQTADTLIRPVLDAAQVLPPFVYLIPALALFEATRFTAIAAAIIFAAPAAIKIVADGIRGVSPTTIEAATAAGSNRWQIITKVQIPMARGAIVLAANQGLLFVLSMVVIGGLVGGQALGYDIVAGFSQGALQGRGLAAALTIVFMGIMLDRITRRAALRVGGK